MLRQSTDKIQSTQSQTKGCILLETKKMNTKYVKQTFDYVAPMLWNALPVQVRTEQNTDIFKRHVKTMLFTDSEEFIRNAFRYD